MDLYSVQEFVCDDGTGTFVLKVHSPTTGGEAAFGSRSSISSTFMPRLTISAGTPSPDCSQLNDGHRVRFRSSSATLTRG